MFLMNYYCYVLFQVIRIVNVGKYKNYKKGGLTNDENNNRQAVR